MHLADSPIKAISLALYVGVIPVSYHSVGAATAMLAAVGFYGLFHQKGFRIAEQAI